MKIGIDSTREIVISFQQTLDRLLKIRAHLHIYNFDGDTMKELEVRAYIRSVILELQEGDLPLIPLRVDIDFDGDAEKVFSRLVSKKSLTTSVGELVSLPRSLGSYTTDIRLNQEGIPPAKIKSSCERDVAQALSSAGAKRPSVEISVLERINEID